MSRTSTHPVIDRAALCLAACDGVGDATLESLAINRVVARLCAVEDAAEMVLKTYDQAKPDSWPVMHPDALTLLALINGPLREALARTRI